MLLNANEVLFRAVLPEAGQDLSHAKTYFNMQCYVATKNFTPLNRTGGRIIIKQLLKKTSSKRHEVFTFGVKYSFLIIDPTSLRSSPARVLSREAAGRAG